MTVDELIEQLQRLPPSASTAFVRVRVCGNVGVAGFIQPLAHPRRLDIVEAAYGGGVVSLLLDE